MLGAFLGYPLAVSEPSQGPSPIYSEQTLTDIVIRCLSKNWANFALQKQKFNQSSQTVQQVAFHVEF